MYSWFVELHSRVSWCHLSTVIELGLFRLCFPFQTVEFDATAFFASWIFEFAWSSQHVSRIWSCSFLRYKICREKILAHFNLFYCHWNLLRKSINVSKSNCFFFVKIRHLYFFMKWGKLQKKSRKNNYVKAYLIWFGFSTFTYLDQCHFSQVKK